MKTGIPEAIIRRMVGCGLCTAFLLVVGVAVSFVLEDGRMLLLTLAVVIIGVLSLLELYYAAAEERYEIAEGIILSQRRIALRNCMRITLQIGSDTEVEYVVAGRIALKCGLRYRLYLQQYEPLFRTPELKGLYPARTVMGHELVQGP